MSKYIIKNCTSYCEFEKEYTCGAETKELFCEDNTDCLLKQIVELCKNKNYFVKRFPMFEHSDGVINSKLAFDILQLLDIQEVE